MATRNDVHLGCKFRVVVLGEIGSTSAATLRRLQPSMRAFLDGHTSPTQTGDVTSPFSALPRATNVGEPNSLIACITLVKDSGGRERKTQVGDTGSDNRTAKTPQRVTQGAYQTSIRPMTSRVLKCLTLAGCQHCDVLRAPLKPALSPSV